MCSGQGRRASHGVERMSCGLLGSFPLLQPKWIRASGEVVGVGLPQGRDFIGKRSGKEKIDFRREGRGGCLFIGYRGCERFGQ